MVDDHTPPQALHLHSPQRTRHGAYQHVSMVQASTPAAQARQYKPGRHRLVGELLVGGHVEAGGPKDSCFEQGGLSLTRGSSDSMSRPTLSRISSSTSLGDRFLALPAAEHSNAHTRRQGQGRRVRQHGDPRLGFCWNGGDNSWSGKGCMYCQARQAQPWLSAGWHAMHLTRPTTAAAAHLPG